MDLLRSVLQEKAVDLVSELTGKAGLTTEEARRFVPEAGTDLIESWRWQANELDTEDVAAESNVQQLLRGIGAKRIASRVGLTAEATWSGLRAFVPMVMRLAGEDGGRAGRGERGSDGDSGGFEALEFGFGLRLVRRAVDPNGWREVQGRGGAGSPDSWNPLEHAIFGYGLRASGRSLRDGGSISYG